MIVCSIAPNFENSRVPDRLREYLRQNFPTRLAVNGEWKILEHGGDDNESQGGPGSAGIDDPEIVRRGWLNFLDGLAKVLPSVLSYNDGWRSSGGEGNAITFCIDYLIYEEADLEPEWADTGEGHDEVEAGPQEGFRYFRIVVPIEKTIEMIDTAEKEGGREIPEEFIEIMRGFEVIRREFLDEGNFIEVDSEMYETLYHENGRDAQSLIQRWESERRENGDSGDTGGI